MYVLFYKIPKIDMIIRKITSDIKSITEAITAQWKALPAMYVHNNTKSCHQDITPLSSEIILTMDTRQNSVPNYPNLLDSYVST